MSLRAALLIGSPRGPKSTSDALGTYLLDRLKERGVSTNKVFIQRSLVSESGVDALLRTVEEADIIIFVSPLYADSHHAGVIAAMELIRGCLASTLARASFTMLACVAYAPAQARPVHPLATQALAGARPRGRPHWPPESDELPLPDFSPPG